LISGCPSRLSELTVICTLLLCAETSKA
jgi:hypothetical protein